MFDNINIKCPRCGREDCTKYLKFLFEIEKFKDKQKDVEKVSLKELWKPIDRVNPCE